MLWILSSPLEGAAETINRLQAHGKTVYFITNNSSRPQFTIADKAHRLNFNIPSDRIITAATATATHLKNLNFTKKAYVVGRAGIEYELAKQGIRCTDAADDEPKSTYVADLTWETLKLDEEVGAVIVNYDPLFNYGKLLKAVNYLRDPECLFVAAGLDDYIPNAPGIVVPGFAPIVRSIQMLAVNQKMHVVGKPSKTICDQLYEDPKFDPKRTLVIGDSAHSDVVLGKNCGFQTLLVGSGVQTLEDIERWQNSGIASDQLLLPDYYIPKLGDLLPFL